MEEEGIAGICWEKYKKEQSIFALHTPFFVCVAADNLDYECFLQCVSQDLHFFQAFIQAYEMVKEYTNDDEVKLAIRHLRNFLTEKICMYDSIVQEWGFVLEKKSISNATAKYRDFLLSTASGIIEEERVPCKTAVPFEKTRVAAYTLAATAPFLRLYIYLCQTIEKNFVPNRHYTYKKWIQYNTNLQIQDIAKKTDDLFNKLSVSLTEEELQVIEKLYHQALKLQVEFFASQPISMRTVVPLANLISLSTQLILFCDFDLTCIEVDSYAILAELAITTSTNLNEFEVISKQYAEGFEECLKSITTGVQATKFDYEGLSKALEKVVEFEKNANAKMEESRLLKGLSLVDIKHAGQNLILQKGCREFLQNTVRKESPKIDIHIISCNWCGDIIRSSFSSDLEALNVHSNELVYEESIATGEIVKKVESPKEKLQVLKEAGTKRRLIRVYIGGAVSDLLCLVEANIGIVFGSNTESLEKVGKHYGVAFAPLIRGVVLNQSGHVQWKSRSGTLYTVDSWAEIQSFILGSIHK